MPARRSLCSCPSIVLSYQLLPITGKAKPETVHLFGGRLCLDFANTVDWSAAGEPIADEVLVSPEWLARWGRRMGVLGAGDDGGAAELAAARELRGALYATFAALSDGAD